MSHGARRRGWLALVLACSLQASSLGAQGDASPALERAIGAYRNLEFDAAASQLEALLSEAATPRLAEGARVRALMYLGATESFRERRASAADAFTRLLLLDPGYRPDQLIFPPEVSSRFDEVRRTVHAVGVIVPAEVEVAAADDAFPVRLHASSPHEVRVMVVDGRGLPVRLLHEGMMGDSIELRWNGRDGLGRLHASGEYGIEVTSQPAPGAADATARVVAVPLRLERLVADTLVPPSPTFTRRPESRRGERRLRPMVIGLLGGVAVAALPSLGGEGSEGMSVRFSVAGAFVAGGIAGLVVSMRSQPLPQNIQWNRQQADAWRLEVDRVRAENAARLQDVRLRIIARPARAREMP